jgi:hypothetical protein
MLHVEVMGRPAKFEGSVGVMGTYPHKGNGQIARDGFTTIKDVNEFGQEWHGRFKRRMETSFIGNNQGNLVSYKPIHSCR